MNHPAFESPRYPSLTEVESIQTPSFTDAFRLAEEYRERMQARRMLLQSSKKSKFIKKCKNSTKPCSASTFAYETNNGFVDSNPAVDAVVQYPTESTTMDAERRGMHSHQSPPQDHDHGVAHPHQQMIEVTPGVHLPLHGIDETLLAIRQPTQHESSNGSVLLASTYCVVCGHSMYCLEYAKLVMCSVCQVISPNTRYRRDPHHCNAGVAMGFTEYEYNAILDQL